MKSERIQPNRGTPLRKNGDRVQEAIIDNEYYDTTYLIKGNSFITRKLTNDDLLIQPGEYFMIINVGDEEYPVYYSEDLDELELIYDPYKYENAEKKNYDEEFFKDKYEIPDDYIDTLPKWYSFKFTYSDYNLIFVRPQLGISFQIHDQRNEFWTILTGEPIIINGKNIHYFVENGTKFEIPINTFHTVINPNKEEDKFIMLEERWNGNFNEEDIARVFNPNNYKK